MTKYSKFFLLLLPVFFSVAVAAIFFANTLTPKTSDSIETGHIKEETFIQYDKWGVPHIFASNKADAYWALGYTVASQRLTQLVLQRLVTRGRLASVFGKKALAHDIKIRELMLYQRGTEAYHANSSPQSQQVRELTKAYLAGLNHFISEDSLPIEVIALGIDIQPFTVEDIFSFVGYLSLSFNEAIRGEILLNELIEKVGPARARDFSSGYPKSAHHIMDQSDSEIEHSSGQYTSHQHYDRLHSDGHQTDHQHTDHPRLNPSASLLTLNHSLSKRPDFIKNLFSFDEFSFSWSGSNSWVLAGHRSQSGSALLANDPHIGVSLPALFFEAVLHTPGWSFNGLFISCLPFAVMGHNQNLGWALTMSKVDELNFFYEQWADKDHLLGPRSLEKIKIKKETVKVRWSDDVEISVARGPRGPLMFKTFPSDKKSVYAVHWTFHKPSYNALEPFYMMSEARTTAELENSVSRGAAPGLSVSMAHKNGEIGWWLFGDVSGDPDPLRIRQGNRLTDQPKPPIPFSEKPKIVNPKNGIIFTTNQAISRDHKIAGHFQDPFRANRLAQLFADPLKTWSLKELKKIQVDTKSLSWDAHRETLLEAIREMPKDQSKFYSLLFDWSGEATVDSSASTFYHHWLNNIYLELLSPFLPRKQTLQIYRLALARHFTFKVLGDPSSQWWDSVLTTTRETRKSVLQKTFLKTKSELLQSLGDSPKNWSWGRYHRLKFVHPLGRLPVLSWFFNLGPFPVSGGNDIISAFSHRDLDRPGEITVLPSVRRLIDFAEPFRTLQVIPTGNSGHLFNKHYQDQTKIYLSGKYKKILINRTLDETENFIRLSPKNQ